MRRLTITENHGLYVVETSAGVRSTGASLESALSKLTLALESPDWSSVAFLFNSIRPVSHGTITEGQAGS